MAIKVAIENICSLMLFIHVFVMFFIKVKKTFSCFYLQINDFFTSMLKMTGPGRVKVCVSRCPSGPEKVTRVQPRSQNLCLCYKRLQQQIGRGLLKL